jgi:uncharacterized damage-inducible protein DinB
MHEIYQSQWLAFEEAKAGFIDRCKLLDENQIHRQEEGGWSIAQVLEHILFSEEGTLGYMKKKTSSGWEQLDETSDAEIAAGRLLVKRLSGENRLQAPSVLPQPGNEASWESLLSRWSQVRISFQQFIEDSDPQFSNKLIFRQPAAGMLNLNQALQFLAQHIQHHYMQIDRIKSTFGWQ